MITGFIYSGIVLVVAIAIIAWCRYRLDADDPARRVVSEIIYKAKKALFVVAAIAVLCAVIGVPHLRSEILFAGPLSRFAPSGATSAGMYVSLTGWTHVDADTFPKGRPIIAFIPLDGCIDVSSWSGASWMRFVPSAYRDGDGASWNPEPVIPADAVQTVSTPEPDHLLTPHDVGNVSPNEPHDTVLPVIRELDPGSTERRGIVDPDAVPPGGSPPRSRPRSLYFSPGN